MSISHTSHSADEKSISTDELDQLDAPGEWSDAQWSIFCRLVDQEIAKGKSNVVEMLCEQVYLIGVPAYEANRQRIHHVPVVHAPIPLSDITTLLEQANKKLREGLVVPPVLVQSAQEKETGRRSAFMRVMNLQFGTRIENYDDLRRSVARRFSGELTRFNIASRDRLTEDVLYDILDTFNPSEDGRVVDFLRRNLFRPSPSPAQNTHPQGTSQQEQAPSQPELQNGTRESRIYYLSQEYTAKTFELAEILQANNRINLVGMDMKTLKRIASAKLAELAAIFGEGDDEKFWHEAKDDMREHLIAALDGSSIKAAAPVQESEKLQATVNEGMDTLLIIQQEFIKSQEAGWKRRDVHQVTFIEWINEYMNNPVDTYEEAVWAFILNYKDAAIAQITEIIRKNPHIPADILLRKGLVGLVKGADRYNQNGDSEPLDFMMKGVEIALFWAVKNSRS